jgi:hypothetical protein
MTMGPNQVLDHLMITRAFGFKSFQSTTEQSLGVLDYQTREVERINHPRLLII